jgi:dTDP-4-amino-4,6-dideoxy-D-galactose acyltransferase
VSTPSLLLENHDAAALYAGAMGSGVRGPHAFIRGLDTDYDRKVMLDQWFRPLNAADDLRFRVEASGEEFWVVIERLPWDSEFFATQTARLNAVLRPHKAAGLREDSTAGARALAGALEQAKRHGIAYIFAPVSPSDLYSMRVLAANGFELIETRCLYHRPLSGPPARRYAVRLAVPADVSSLARAARTMVNPYDRFHADLAISDRDAGRMMERWVEASILDGFADATIVPDVDAPEAFSTVKYHRAHWQGWGLKLGQTVFSVVSLRHKGWHVRILSELDEHLRNIGAEHSFITTQLTNHAVIRCVEKLGYQFGKGEHIFRKLL